METISHQFQNYQPIYGSYQAGLLMSYEIGSGLSSMDFFFIFAQQI